MALNKPFAGTYVPLRFPGENALVNSVMIEIDRTLSMNEGTDEKLDSFDEIKELIGRTIDPLSIICRLPPATRQVTARREQNQS